MRRCYVIRGLPGSGKSTHARRIIEAASVPGVAVSHLEADQYHVKDGKYDFKVENIRAAHTWCYNTFCHAVLNHANLIIVSNTSLLAWEFAPYYRHAEANGYDVTLVTILCDPEVAFARQVHGVPRSTYDRMIAAFEDGGKQIPSFWNHAVVDTRTK